MRRKIAYQTINDMPPVMRTVCQCITADEFRRGQHWDTAKIAQKIGTQPNTVQMHIGRAMRATGTKSRRDLADWCRRGRGVGVPTDGPPAPQFTAAIIGPYGRPGKLVVMKVHTALHAISLADPLGLVSYVSRWRDSPEGKRKISEARDAAGGGSPTPTPVRTLPAGFTVDLSTISESERQLAADRIAAGLGPEKVYDRRITDPNDQPDASRWYLPWIPGETSREHDARCFAAFGPRPPRS